MDNPQPLGMKSRRARSIGLQPGRITGYPYDLEFDYTDANVTKPDAKCYSLSSDLGNGSGRVREVNIALDYLAPRSPGLRGQTLDQCPSRA